MARELTLMAEPRTALGKKNKALRRTGRVPGVIYGPGMDATIQVSVDRRELERTYTQLGLSTLLTVKVEGAGYRVMIREVQVEPVRYAPLHVDFFKPDLLKEMEARVTISLHGEIEIKGAVLTHAASEATIRAMPEKIPQHLDADVSGLREVGDVFRLGDVPLPDGVTLVSDPDLLIASIQAVAAEEAPEVTEAVETAATSTEAAAPEESE